MRIYFARHAESQANLLHEISNRGLKHGLTHNGRAQAANLANKLQDIPLTCIYTSPVLRAIETCLILAHRLNLDYEVVEALREYDCGIIEGRSDDAGWQMWQELFDAWNIHQQWEKCIEGGESFYDLQARFLPFIDDLIHQYGATDSNLLCISHGGLYRMMLPQVLQNAGDLFAPNQPFNFDYTACIIGELCSTKLNYVGKL